MRIAVWHNLPSGGAKRALYYQIKYLLAKGHFVEVWCPSTANCSFMPLDDIVRENVYSITWPSVPGTSLLGYLTKYINISKKINILNQHSKIVAHEIKQNNYDVLLSHGDQYTATPSIARYVQLPSVLYLQEPNRQIYEAFLSTPINKSHKPKKLFNLSTNTVSKLRVMFKAHGNYIQAKQELINAKSFNRILVNSYYSRESIIRAYGLESYVCYLGVDVEKFKPNNTTKFKNKIIGIGSITRAKNIEFIIKALSLIPDKNIELTWVGNFADENYYKLIVEYAKTLSVDLNIRIDLDEEELLLEIRKSYLMVYSPRLEPFGFVPLEANACGIPVIAVAEGGVRETIRNGVNGFLCSNDPVDMADKIRMLYENNDIYDSLCNTCRKYVENNWTWDKSIDELEKQLVIAINTK